MIKNECVLNRKYFSLYEVPDLILKKKIPRKEYQDKLLDFLKNVKKNYLVQMKLEDPDNYYGELSPDYLVPLLI